MNQDFMLLKDNTVEVTNEEGKEINRGKFENNDIKNILLVENKVEMIETIEEQLEKQYIENRKVVFLANGMLIISAVILALAVLGGFAYGAISHPSDYLTYGMVRSIEGFSGAIIPTTIVTIYCSIIKPIYKKQIKKIEKILNKTNAMKKECEEELQIEKEKLVTNTLEPLVKISLERENCDIATQITEELTQYCEENIQKRGKVKVRKR